MDNLIRFEVSQRYQVFTKVGEGSFGQVISAKDKNLGIDVAIKRIECSLQDEYELLQTYRELVILRHCNHPNVLQLVDIIYGPSGNLYMVSDLMCCDMRKLIRHFHSSQWDLDVIRHLMFQVLNALEYLHMFDIIHRDLKPENILIDWDGEVKICDLGLARLVKLNHFKKKALTEYVVTRYYRAPEVMLSSCRYTKAIDIWAVGCILAELFKGKPIFRGKDFKDQLLKIFSILGKPSYDDLHFVGSRKAREFVLDTIINNPITLEELIPTAPKEVIQLIRQLLMFNPDERLSATQALQHPFFDIWRSFTKTQSLDNVDSPEKVGMVFSDLNADNPNEDETSKCPEETKKGNIFDEFFSFEDDIDQILDDQYLKSLIQQEVDEFHRLAEQDEPPTPVKFELLLWGQRNI